MKKFLTLILLLSCGCASERVELLGEYTDCWTEVRYEVYLRQIKSDNCQHLAHDNTLQYWSPEESKNFIKHLQGIK